jgi:hypothetical protein
MQTSIENAFVSLAKMVFARLISKKAKNGFDAGGGKKTDAKLNR